MSYVLACNDGHRNPLSTLVTIFLNSFTLRLYYCWVEIKDVVFSLSRPYLFIHLGRELAYLNNNIVTESCSPCDML